MINKLFIFAGIILMVYSAIYCFKIVISITNPKLKKAWIVLYILIVFFLFGYIGYLILDLSTDALGPVELLVSLILFFGSVFVVIVLKVNRYVMDSLNQSLADLQGKNESLTEMAKELDDDKGKLENARKELEDKNKELQDTMEDFYTLRVKMGEHSKKIKKENLKVRKKIKRLNT